MSSRIRGAVGVFAAILLPPVSAFAQASPDPFSMGGLVGGAMWSSVALAGTLLLVAAAVVAVVAVPWLRKGGRSPWEQRRARRMDNTVWTPEQRLAARARAKP
ncbi:MAG: hypothetical protein HY904_13825 [Deltaproteobacteria bacterium]|nr:hypothetical protein [Deltaproteobacteria bacterium]